MLFRHQGFDDYDGSGGGLSSNYNDGGGDMMVVLVVTVVVVMMLLWSRRGLRDGEPITAIGLRSVSA